MLDNYFFLLFSIFKNNFLFLRLKNLFGNSKLDIAKRAGRVGFRLGQSGHWSKWVTGQNGSFLNQSIGSRVKLGCESGRVDPYFSNNFFFFK